MCRNIQVQHKTSRLQSDMDMGENMRAAFSIFNYWILERTRFWRWNRPLFFYKSQCKSSKTGMRYGTPPKLQLPLLGFKDGRLGKYRYPGFSLATDIIAGSIPPLKSYKYKYFANRTLSICQSFWCSPGYLGFDPLPLMMGNVVNQSINISDLRPQVDVEQILGTTASESPRFTRQNVSSLLVRQP